MFDWTGKFDNVIFDDEADCMFGQDSITDKLEAKLNKKLNMYLEK